MRLGPEGEVVALSSDAAHRFSKQPTSRIEVVAGKGVLGDAHFGATVQHLSRIKADPDQPNLRQVHLIQSELFDELRERGFEINPGDMGENILTRGIDLLNLGRDTMLRIGKDAVLNVTGLRNPCQQIENFQPGLLKEVVEKKGGEVIRKAGIMTVVIAGGEIRAGDPIFVDPLEGDHIPLERV